MNANGQLYNLKADPSELNNLFSDKKFNKVKMNDRGTFEMGYFNA